MEGDRMTGRRLFDVFALVLVVSGVAGPAAAAETDVWTRIEGTSAGPPGGEIALTVHYGNRGPDSATSAYLNLELPIGVPGRADELSSGDVMALEASMEGTDTLGNDPMLFWNDTCDGLTIQLQGHVDGGFAPIGELAPGESGSFRIAVRLPMEPPATAGLWVESPPYLAHRMTNLGFGECDACGDLSACFGLPLSMVRLQSVEAVVARDGSASDPTLACDEIINDVDGKVAVIRRGDCDMGVKAFNAENAGALATVIVNNGVCADGVDPDCVITMQTGNWVYYFNPVVMISQAEGEPLIAAIEQGQIVELSMGGFATTALVFESIVWTTSADDTDPDLTNNLDRHVARFNTLAPGGPVRPGGRRVP